MGIDDPALRRLVTDNPAAAAEVFHVTIKLVFTILLGQTPNIKSSTRSATQTGFFSVHDGIFGTPLATYVVSETQDRGALHAHGCHWSAVSPYVLERLAGHTELESIFHEVLASQFITALPVYVHARQLVQRAHELIAKEAEHNGAQAAERAAPAAAHGSLADARGRSDSRRSRANGDRQAAHRTSHARSARLATSRLL
jgi:hypothetical protein